MVPIFQGVTSYQHIFENETAGVTFRINANILLVWSIIGINKQDRKLKKYICTFYVNFFSILIKCSMKTVQNYQHFQNFTSLKNNFILQHLKKMTQVFRNRLKHQNI